MLGIEKRLDLGILLGLELGQLILQVLRVLRFDFRLRPFLGRLHDFPLGGLGGRLCRLLCQFPCSRLGLFQFLFLLCLEPGLLSGQLLRERLLFSLLRGCLCRR